MAIQHTDTDIHKLEFFSPSFEDIEIKSSDDFSDKSKLYGGLYTFSGEFDLKNADYIKYFLLQGDKIKDEKQVSVITDGINGTNGIDGVDGDSGLTISVEPSNINLTPDRVGCVNDNITVDVYFYASQNNHSVTVSKVQMLNSLTNVAVTVSGNKATIAISKGANLGSATVTLAKLQFTVVTSNNTSAEAFVTLSKVSEGKSLGKIDYVPTSKTLTNVKYDSGVDASGNITVTNVATAYAFTGDLVVNIGNHASPNKADVYRFNGSGWDLVNNDVNACIRAFDDIMAAADSNLSTVICNRLIAQNAFIKNLAALKILFKEFVASVQEENVKVGDQLISMGKNPKDLSDKDFSFIIQKCIQSGDNEVWTKHLWTKFLASGLLALCTTGCIQAPDIRTGESDIWTVLDTGIYHQASSICFYNNKYYVGGELSTITYSSDLKTWSQLESKPMGLLGEIYDMCTNEGKLFAVGKYATSITTFNARISVYNGSTWTNSNFTECNYLHSITYGNGIYVTVGNEGKAYYSTNGIDWIGTDIKFGNTSAYAVNYLNGTFIAVGDASKISISKNGKDWTLVNSSSKTNPPFLYAVAYGNNQYIAVGEFESIAYSCDGINWTFNNYKESVSTNFYSIAFEPENKLFVIGGDNKILQKRGESITEAYTNITSNITFRDLAIINNFIIGCGTNGYIAYTKDYKTVGMGIIENDYNKNYEISASGQVRQWGEFNINVSKGEIATKEIIFPIRFNSTKYYIQLSYGFSGNAILGTEVFYSNKTKTSIKFNVYNPDITEGDVKIISVHWEVYGLIS